MEKPAQMRAVALPWPNQVRPRCHTCRRRLHRARQIDGTVINYCEAGCRNELGLPFCAEQRSDVRATAARLVARRAA